MIRMMRMIRPMLMVSSPARREKFRAAVPVPYESKPPGDCAPGGNVQSGLQPTELPADRLFFPVGDESDGFGRDIAGGNGHRRGLRIDIAGSLLASRERSASDHDIARARLLGDDDRAGNDFDRRRAGACR